MCMMPYNNDEYIEGLTELAVLLLLDLNKILIAVFHILPCMDIIETKNMTKMPTVLIFV